MDMMPHPRRRTSRVIVWVATTLAAFALLTLLVSHYPENRIDLTVLRWATSWDAPGLRGFMESISWLTDLWPRLVPAVLAVVWLFLFGHRVAALSIAFSFVILLGPIELLDWASGVAVGRFRPNGAPFFAFPSGHALGTVVMFGFVIYLARRLPIGTLARFALFAVSGVLLIAVGPSRLILGAHWPTDVLGSYLLGTAALVGFIATYEAFERRLAVLVENSRLDT
jgi:undecaprenyl-diphosphatase